MAILCQRNFSKNTADQVYFDPLILLRTWIRTRKKRVFGLDLDFKISNFSGLDPGFDFGLFGSKLESLAGSPKSESNPKTRFFQIRTPDKAS